MGTAFAITRLDLTASGLREAATEAKDVAAARRMLCLAMVLDGADRTSAAGGDMASATLEPDASHWIICQLSAIGYFARISPIRLSAFSAAACGVIPSRMMSASAPPQTCWAATSAKPGLKAE
jgi:hypothetical protein